MLKQQEALMSRPTVGDAQSILVKPQSIVDTLPTPLPLAQPHQIAVGSLSQMLGLHFIAALLTIVVDMMVFTGDVASLGLLIPVAIGAGGILGYIVYLIQRRFYGDDHQAALIKCLAVALLTAIPAPLAPLITVPSGIIGVVSMVRRKRG